jgi:hypothetical protein
VVVPGLELHLPNVPWPQITGATAQSEGIDPKSPTFRRVHSITSVLFRIVYFKTYEEPDMPTPPTPAIEHGRDPRRWLVLAVMSIGTVIVFLDGTVVNTALPNISTKLSATTSQLQWVVDSYISSSRVCYSSAAPSVTVSAVVGG